MTIPAMKKTGFTPSYSAAVEACASTGAVLAPPVLGATAFVMAQFLNTGYSDVALAATIPSVLYYFGLFAQVDSYAARHQLQGLPRKELPRFWDAFKEGWYYLFVIIILVVMLLYFKRESHGAVLCNRAAGYPASMVGPWTLETCQHRVLCCRVR